MLLVPATRGLHCVKTDSRTKCWCNSTWSTDYSLIFGVGKAVFDLSTDNSHANKEVIMKWFLLWHAVLALKVFTFDAVGDPAGLHCGLHVHRGGVVASGLPGTLSEPQRDHGVHQWGSYHHWNEPGNAGAPGELVMVSPGYF
jgi:hypothetical protein